MPATWGKNTLTNQALTMMNQALGISAITFTKAVTITDDITGDSVSQLQALTSVNYKQSRTPKAIATQDNKSRLGVTIDNSDVNEDYTYYGVGLYAKQNSTNQEVLFSVIPLTAGATMIAKENNATTASIYLDLYTDIVRGTQVTIMVSNSGTLSREDVQQMISQSIGNALNYPNETASIGTDLDTILDISITRIINDTTVVHAPSGFSGTGYLITIGSGDKTVPIVHTLDDTINNIRSTRYFNSTTNVWSEWNAYAKTVDVNQQLDKKVNIADMRKPASDVAGIEEVSAKQDKIGYTPADDSKVVHSTDMRKPASDVVGLEDVSTSVYQSQLANGTDIHTVTKDGIYPLGFSYVNFMDSYSHWGTLQVINNNAVIIHIARIESSIWFESCSGSPAQWNPWHKLSSDDKVAHLSGTNNFDTVPTVNNNPLLLASSLPSDLARTGQANTFTAAQTFSIAPTIKDASTDKGDNQAATMADLKSVENSAWRQLNVATDYFGSYEGIYKINSDEKYLEICASGIMIGSNKDVTLFDLSPIVDEIINIDMELIVFSDLVIDSVHFNGPLLTAQAGGNGYNSFRAHISSYINNGFARVYYNNLQPGVI